MTHSFPSPASVWADGAFQRTNVEDAPSLHEAAASLAGSPSEIPAGSSDSVPPPTQTEDFDPLQQYGSSDPLSDVAPISRQGLISDVPAMRASSPYSPERIDLGARGALREVVFSALMSDTLSPRERVALLDDCKATAKQSGLGIPFRELLSEPMQPFGVPPLMYELMSCQPDWDGINDEDFGNGMELVLFLIEYWNENVIAHGNMGMLSWVVRTACLRRADEEGGNKLFQQLRSTIFHRRGYRSGYADYDILVTPLGAQGTKPSSSFPDFSALISLPCFASQLAHTTSQNEIPGDVSQVSRGKKPLPPDPARVNVDFLAARRAWRLEIDSNELKLELVDGPGGSEPCESEDEPALYIDARVNVVAPDPADLGSAGSASSAAASLPSVPIELLLPRALLRPIGTSGQGTHVMKLSPCFSSGSSDYHAPRGFDDARFLHDYKSALLLELTVRLARDPLAFPPRAIAEHEQQRLIQSHGEPVVGSSGIALESADDNDDLYAPEGYAVVGNGRTAGNLPSEADEWEKVSQADETEETEGGWVKASWSGKDEEL
ncbi:hypothetical protein DFH11DRAFT_1066181 [Phellopilus nigrolimitatus]|nr:hypothetical protein DFH11DRAFT_1066181 [Phellopilus nigrolimitatus]